MKSPELEPIALSVTPARQEGAPSALKQPASARGLSNFVTNPYVQIGLNALVVTASELFLKMGARQTANLNQSLAWTGITGLASVWTWLGILCVILSLVSWLNILRQIPLSIAFPLSNVVHVLVPLTSWIALNELISPRRWLGIALVLIGLVIVAKPFARIEEKL